LFSKNRSGDMFQSRSSAKSTTKMDVIRWMEEILHQLIGGLYPIRFQPSKVMQDFFHPQYDIILHYIALHYTLLCYVVLCYIILLYIYIYRIDIKSVCVCLCLQIYCKNCRVKIARSEPWLVFAPDSAGRWSVVVMWTTCDAWPKKGDSNFMDYDHLQ
jgi:hypothetical protein